eukprot:TRINITY_DN643_c0_g1_i1.p1 TRINITY_DN643_c0_g1~~TRINITY_DN643_c0_g1_i1.p1  ORF type:complete len:168 (+),score=36.56 TRINITY_DN643_c0_g1_i1:53-505(+)
MASADERVDFNFPRNYSSIDKLEEAERQERLNKAVDPILLGKHHRLGDAVLSHPSSLGGAAASASSAISGAASSLSSAISDMSGNLMNKASAAVDSAKASLGMDPSSIASMASEEKERQRRMSDERVDPKLAAQKHQVERELLNSVKANN